MSKTRPVLKRVRTLMRDREYPEQRIGKLIEPQPNGCWMFRGDLTEYGHVHAYNGREAAHRYVYRTLVGAIPPRSHLHHRCGNKGCVNPAHLLPVTAPEHGKIHNA